MVDPVTSNAIGTDRRVAAPSRVAAPATVTQPAARQPEATSAPTVAAQLAASAPVDFERVQRIKSAVDNGTFPISPVTIADRLIALRYEWMNNDQA